MKIIRKVSQEEMHERFPDLMAGLTSDKAIYCDNCDGVRAADKEWKCLVCGKQGLDPDILSLKSDNCS